MERRYSKKREAILHCLRATDSHPTAGWIYDTLSHDYPDLSLATVYRNLRLFQTEGLIQSVGTVDGLERFDGDTSPHNHFVCRICGRVCDCPAALPSIPDAPEGATVESVSLVYHGVCRDCNLKTQKESKI